METQDTMPATTGLPPGCLTLRQAADALDTSTTALRKMIRQGQLPEAEKVRTIEGRVWSVRLESILSIAERCDFAITVADSIDLRDPLDVSDPKVSKTAYSEDVAVEADVHARSADELGGRASSIAGGRRLEPVPSASIEPEEDFPAPVTQLITPTRGARVSTAGAPAGTAIEAAGDEGSVEPIGPPTLAEVLDTALLEKLLGAKDAETAALVKAERRQTEFESLAARQLELERRYESVEVQRQELAKLLHDEALGRAIADARVTELRDQLQREISYAEAERFERRQALARETLAISEAARTRSVLGWLGRRRLGKSAT